MSKGGNFSGSSETFPSDGTVYLLEGFESSGDNNTATEPPLRFSSHIILKSDYTVENPFLMVPMGFMFSPFSILNPSPVSLKRNPIICLGCAAYISPFVNIDLKTADWQCPFCNYVNPCYSDELIGYSGDVTPAFPELSHKIVEYSDHLSHTDPSMIIPLATGPHRQREHRNVPALIFLIDGTIIDENMEELKDSMLAALTAANHNCSIGLLIFSSVVKIFRLGIRDLIVSDTFSGTELSGLSSIEKNVGEYLVHMDTGIDSIIEALNSVRGIPVPARKTNRRMHKALENFAGMDVEGRYCSSMRKARCQKRCFGIAVEYALQLAQNSEREGSHIVCCISGCPNYGPGAIISHDAGRTAEIDEEILRGATRYYRELSKQALNQGTAIDIFCGGAERLGIPVMQSLVEKTGGYTLVHTSFASQFCENLQKILMSQAVSSHGAFRGCIVDIRTSRNIRIKHVIGPAGVSDQHDEVDRTIFNRNLQAASHSSNSPFVSDGGTKLDDGEEESVPLPEYESLCRMIMGRKDPISTLSVYYESAFDEDWASSSEMLHENDPSLTNAFFQFVVRYATDGQVITRVVTHRLPITQQTETYLDSLDEDVVGVLIAKQAILQGSNLKVDSVQCASVEQAQADIDFSLQSISRQYRTYAQNHGGGRAKPPNFPPILSGLPRRLFQLRRGPLLGSMIQNMDDASCLRNLFLRAPLSDCLRMMSPDLLCWEPGAHEPTSPAPEDLPPPPAGSNIDLPPPLPVNGAKVSDSETDTGEADGLAEEGHAVTVNTTDSDENANNVPHLENPNAGAGTPSTAAKSSAKLCLKVLPMETLAMQSNKILVLDHHDRVLIWSGQEVCGKEYDYVREAFQHHTYLSIGNRIPTPTIALFKEGSSMSRFFISRLIPSHKDPIDTQLEMFPELRLLSIQDLQRFCEKFPKTDDSSFFQYFWNIVR